MEYLTIFFLAVPILIYYLIKLFKSPVSLLPEFTLSDLEEYDGRNGKIYIGVKETVFDVSECESYKPGESYSMFAGKDGTVALARMSLNPENMNIQAKLTAQEEKTLQEWVVYYTVRKQYPVVGRLKKA